MGNEELRAFVAAATEARARFDEATADDGLHQEAAAHELRAAELRLSEKIWRTKRGRWHAQLAEADPIVAAACWQVLGELPESVVSARADERLAASVARMREVGCGAEEIMAAALALLRGKVTELTEVILDGH